MYKLLKHHFQIPHLTNKNLNTKAISCLVFVCCVEHHFCNYTAFVIMLANTLQYLNLSKFVFFCKSDAWRRVWDLVTLLEKHSRTCVLLVFQGRDPVAASTTPLAVWWASRAALFKSHTLLTKISTRKLFRVLFLFAEGVGLEPTCACARRISSAVRYQFRATLQMIQFYTIIHFLQFLEIL